MNKNIDRRDFIKLTGAAGATVLLSGLAPIEKLAESDKKKNVLFVVVDDLRPEIGCYGHRQMLSPNIDRMASEGVIFNCAYCQVPVCGASRASLLTSMRPTRNRFVDFKTWKQKDAPDAVSLPMHFKNNGYHTISNGKVYHHIDDDKDSWCEEPWRAGDEELWRDYQLQENKAIADKSPRKAGPPFEAADVPDKAYRDGKNADKSIADLNRLKGMSKPFFLAVGFSKPHLPFNAPKKYWDLYKREEINLADNPFRPKGAPDAALHNWGELRQYFGIPPKGPLSEDMARTLIHGYYACVSYTDAQIGRVLAELDRLGLRDNTVIVLWGDHGWQLGEHGLWCKHCNFETSLHSPMIVAAAGVEGGKRTDALTEFVDIYPSLCELCDLPIPSHVEGKSFVPLMKDPNLPWKKAVYSRYENGDSIKTHRYRYTEWRDDTGKIYARMLYDHQNDPAENVNISELPEHKELVEELSKMLQELKK